MPESATHLVQEPAQSAVSMNREGQILGRDPPKAGHDPGRALLHYIDLRVLTATVLAELMDAVLSDTRRQSQPPARVVVRNRLPARRRNLITVAGKPGTVQS
jgi:hypothetical protein